MKKLATLILAAGMVVGAATGAKAIDFKAKGQWLMSFDYGEHGNFVKNNGAGKSSYGWGKGGEDDFEARQRVRLQLDAVASESLSGTVQFEIGDQIWGRADQGGAVGADGKIIELKHAYIDWMLPDTDLKVRMGIQNVTLPSFTIGGSTVMAEDVAGIVASYQFNENVGVTGVWMRPFNDNYTRNDSPTGINDNIDVGALLIPLTFDGIKVTPWGAYGGAGPNAFRADKTEVIDYLTNANPSGKQSAYGYLRTGLLPVPVQKDYSNGYGKLGFAHNPSEYANIWYGGATGEFTIWDPLRIAWDFTYGSVTWDGSKSINRTGWLVSALVEYKMDWGVPGLLFWYGSGDDNNPNNGSERMPTIASNNTNDFSHFAFNGDPYIARDGVISNGDMGGLWGVGARVKDMSFIEDLKHTFRVNFIGGTNSPKMAKYMSTAGLWANGLGTVASALPYGAGYSGMYMTTNDYALELGLTNTYKMYENFTVSLEGDYIAMWLDTSKSVWGAGRTVGRHTPSTADAWNINATFCYQF